MYHFGWGPLDGAAAPGGPGKMVRGALTMQVAEAVSGSAAPP